MNGENQQDQSNGPRWHKYWRKFFGVQAIIFLILGLIFAIVAVVLLR